MLANGLVAVQHHRLCGPMNVVEGVWKGVGRVWQGRGRGAGGWCGRGVGRVWVHVANTQEYNHIHHVDMLNIQSYRRARQPNYTQPHPPPKNHTVPLCAMPNLCVSTDMEVTPGTAKSKGGVGYPGWFIIELWNDARERKKRPHLT